MIGLYLTFGALSLIGLAAAIYWSIRSHGIYKTNLLVSSELDKIIESTLKAIQKSKLDNKDTSTTPADILDIDSPGVMSTLITVLVNKFGTVRLGMQDFIIPDEEYVSIYVDDDTQEIILSLNHDLVSKNMYVDFKDPTDKTFH